MPQPLFIRFCNREAGRWFLKTSSAFELLDLNPKAGSLSAAVLHLILMLVNSLFVAFRTRAKVQAEMIALRRQLTVLQRTQKPKRLVVNRADRCLWVWLSRLWSDWRSCLIIVKPETVIGWHRQGFRWYWDLEGSSRSVGPSASSEGNS